MNKGFEMLLELVRSEMGSCSKILSLYEERKEKLIVGDIMRIIELNKQEEDLVKELKHMEMERQTVFRELCRSYKLPVEEGTLCKFAELVAPEYVFEANRLKNDFTEKLEAIRKLTVTNRVLIKSSLEYYDGTLSLILGEAQETVPQIYATGGYVSAPTKTRSFLDQKV